MSAASIVLGAVLVAVVVPAAVIDLRHRIIPNKITGVGAVLAVVIGTALEPSGEPARLVAGAIAGGYFLTAMLVYPGGIGMGDVKLAGVMGLFLGVAVVPATLIALLSGLIVGVTIIAPRVARMRRQAMVPLGPFLAFGAIAAVFCGQPLVNLYVDHFLH